MPEREGPGAKPVLAHVAPFVAWLFVMQMLGDPEGWKYAVRSVICLGLFVWLRPWQWYGRLELKNVPLAIGVGLLVFGLWVVGETPWFEQAFPWVHDVYVRFGVLPWGRPREELVYTPYAPEVCGWTLTVIRIAGSALVIGIIEEFFWRGFLYRWFASRNWLEMDPGKLDKLGFFVVALAFGLEHSEWFVGFLTGLIYGWMYVKTRDIWSVAIAHALTNAVLGIYVVKTGSYFFW